MEADNGPVRVDLGLFSAIAAQMEFADAHPVPNRSDELVVQDGFLLMQMKKIWFSLSNSTINPS